LPTLTRRRWHAVPLVAGSTAVLALIVTGSFAWMYLRRSEPASFTPGSGPGLLSSARAPELGKLFEEFDQTPELPRRAELLPQMCQVAPQGDAQARATIEERRARYLDEWVKQFNALNQAAAEDVGQRIEISQLMRALYNQLSRLGAFAPSDQSQREKEQ